MENQCCQTDKTKIRTTEIYTDLIHRLNRIEGQVKGIRGMVEKNAYCADILVQVAAASSALNGFAKTLLGASAPLIIGAAIAYIVNIPMSFYERHIFSKTNKKVLQKLKRPMYA